MGSLGITRFRFWSAQDLSMPTPPGAIAHLANARIVSLKEGPDRTACQGQRRSPSTRRNGDTACCLSR